MRHRIVRALAFALLALVLASCGLLNSLVPPVDDPLGVDGEVLTMTRTDVTPTSATLAPQQTGASTFSGNVSVTVGELSDPPAEPKSLATELGFSTVVLVSDASLAEESDFPSTLTVTSMALDVTLEDASASASIEIPASSMAVAFERDACMVDGLDRRCTYAPSATAVQGLAILISGGVFDSFFDVVTNDATPNTLSGTISMSVDPGLDVDILTAEATLQTTEGTIEVF